MRIFAGYLRMVTRRPVAWTLLALGPLLGALLAGGGMPLSPLPEIALPTILVSAILPGGNADSIATTVATPLERTLGIISGVTEMTSISTTGSTRIALQFDPSRDQHGAARDVEAAIAAARRLLPANLPSNPGYKAINSAEPPVMLLTLTSDTLSPPDLYDLATTRVVNEISQLSDVGAVDVSGASLPAVRVQLSPARMAAYGLTFEEARRQLTAANSFRPIGALTFGSAERQLLSNSALYGIPDYREVILKYRDSAPVRVGDVGAVIRSGENSQAFGLVGDRPGVVLTVRRRAGGNIMRAGSEVRDLLPELRKALPASVTLATSMDFTESIRRSIRESTLSLLASAILVTVVVMGFLRDWRAGLIASIALPVALSATLVVIRWLGFSLNTLTLMALSIACGFVIDDAIVVLDSISRELEGRASVRLAVARAVRQMTPALFAMMLSMISLLAPVLFWGGMVGAVIHEFAWTLAISMLISVLVSLTVITSFSARQFDGRRRAVRDGTHRSDSTGERFYRRTLELACRYRKTVGAVIAALIAINVALFTTYPKTFLPRQDRGLLIGSVRLNTNTSTARMKSLLTDLGRRISADSAVRRVIIFTGTSATGDASMFVLLNDAAHRPSADAVAARLGALLNADTGVQASLTAAQDFAVGTRQAIAQYQMTVLADNLDDVAIGTRQLMTEMQTLPGLRDVTSDLDVVAQEALVSVDRSMASRFDITPASIDATLYDAFGDRQIAVLYRPENQYHLILEADPRYRSDPASLREIYVSGANGKVVPLESVAQFRRSTTWQTINHDGNRVAATISFNLARGTSLSQAIARIDAAKQGLVLPKTVTTRFAGVAGAYSRSQADQVIVLIAALLAVYLVLGIFYEDLVHPLTVLSVLPGTGLGAFAALAIGGLDFSMVTLIAFLLVAGIAMKNSIMIVNEAIDLVRDRLLPASDAVVEAAVRRLRPITMTSIAAIGAGIPLVLSSGAGSEFLRPLGVAVVGGLTGGYVLTLYLTPAVFLAMAGLQRFFRTHVLRANYQ
ncbi:efflux RND transporter permease subunit [Burkholderia orbicola]|uniref:efflux RND transporter permease subunit n=1 Tax=Burkholderia orbicola TaxID=2978683 RepID=UPI002FE1A4DB